MADKTITITAPTSTTPGVRIILDRTASGGITAAVVYAPGSGLPDQVAFYSAAEVAAAPAAVLNAINTLFTAVMAPSVAPARMGFV